MSLGFQWDPRKAAVSEKKHGVGFEEAITVFDDPLARIFLDEWHSEGEAREIIVGHSSTGRLLLVAFAEQPDGTLRVISARCATPRENAIMNVNHQAEDLLPEYDFDYAKSRPNRFAGHGKAAVTLDDDVFAYLQARADEKGRRLSDLVNDLLKREIDLVEAVK